MDIRTFIEAEHISQEQFGKLVGVSQGLVWQWISGKTTVTAERALQIERATAGQVTRHDLRPDIFGAAPEKANAA